MKEEVLRLAKKYKVPLSSLNKEVLVDEELLEEASSYLIGSVTAPFAFPGFVFRTKRGHALEIDERKLTAVREEYGVPGELFEPPEFSLLDDSIFLEPDSRYSRDALLISLIHQPRSIVVVTRESVLITLVAEPGWREYSPITVISDLFYEKDDVFRLSNDAFYPPGKSSMGMAFLRLKSPYPSLRDFATFLKHLFTQRKKKIKLAGVKTEKRVDHLYPDELLDLFETTRTR